MDRQRLRVTDVRRGRMLPVDDPAPCDECARLTAEIDRLRAFVAVYDAYCRSDYGVTWHHVREARAAIDGAAPGEHDR